MLEQPFSLPCGVTLSNRIAKAAMTERLAGRDHQPNGKHYALYRHWAKGNTALLVSGNIMIDRRCLESAGNIVLDRSSDLGPFREWTNVVRKEGKQFWAQLSHPGRQATIFTSWRPVSASSVRLKKLGLFARPRTLEHHEIERIRDSFIETALRCREAGFTGIQVHAAHGYLISQFLSPRTNHRTDQWGGPVENRARLLMEIVSGIRKEAGAEYPVSVKLNSADFLRGGFGEEDALKVIHLLEGASIDLLEVSGGTYEQVAFLQNTELKASTRAREAFFLAFAKKVRKASTIPLMVTGGFRSRTFCDQVLGENALDVIGFGRPYLLQEDFPGPFLEGKEVGEKPLRIPFRALQDMVEGGWYDYQLWRLANEKGLGPDYPPILAVARLTWNELWKGIRNRLCSFYI